MKGSKLAAILTVLLNVALFGGCPSDTGDSEGSLNGIPELEEGLLNPEEGEAPLEFDPAEAAGIVNRTPRTMAELDFESARLGTLIDDAGNLHEFAMFVDNAGAEYLGEYALVTAAGRLEMDFELGGQVTTVAVEDFETGDAVQISVDWTDPTNLLANMTNVVSNNITAFKVDLSKAVPKMLNARAAAPRAAVVGKLESRTEPSVEERLSLNVKVRLVDGAGYPVTDMRPIFRLRSKANEWGSAQDLSCAVSSGQHIGDGVYTTQLGAYRYVSSNAGDWMATAAETVGEATTPAGAILLATPGLNKAVGTGVTLLGGILWAESKLNPREYNFAPHPTALGLEMNSFEVSVSAGDRTNATALLACSRWGLYKLAVPADQEIDLGTLVVTPFFQPAPPGYRLYYVTAINQLEVREEGAEDRDIPMCSLAGGGLDCTVMAEFQPFGDVFATEQEAVLSICSEVENLRILPLGVGPAADVRGQYMYLSHVVHSYLATCTY